MDESNNNSSNLSDYEGSNFSCVDNFTMVHHQAISGDGSTSYLKQAEDDDVVMMDICTTKEEASTGKGSNFEEIGEFAFSGEFD